MCDTSPYKKLLIYRMGAYMEDTKRASINCYNSPLFDILRVTNMFGMLNMAIGMANNTHLFSKTIWKKEVWSRAWKVDNEEWGYTSSLFSDTHYLKSILSDTAQYLIWWDISNIDPCRIGVCENIAAMICRSSQLKSDSIEYKNSVNSNRACQRCNNFEEENVAHLIMRCETHDALRQQIFDVIEGFDVHNNTHVRNSPNLLLHILGKDIPDVCFDAKVDLWKKLGEIINAMYIEQTRDRCGVG